MSSHTGKGIPERSSWLIFFKIIFFPIWFPFWLIWKIFSGLVHFIFSSISFFFRLLLLIFLVIVLAAILWLA